MDKIKKQLVDIKDKISLLEAGLYWPARDDDPMNDRDPENMRDIIIEPDEEEDPYKAYDADKSFGAGGSAAKNPDGTSKWDAGADGLSAGGSADNRSGSPYSKPKDRPSFKPHPRDPDAEKNFFKNLNKKPALGETLKTDSNKPVNKSSSFIPSLGGGINRVIKEIGGLMDILLGETKDDFSDVTDEVMRDAGFRNTMKLYLRKQEAQPSDVISMIGSITSVVKSKSGSRKVSQDGLLKIVDAYQNILNKELAGTNDGEDRLGHTQPALVKLANMGKVRMRLNDAKSSSRNHAYVGFLVIFLFLYLYIKQVYEYSRSETTKEQFEWRQEDIDDFHYEWPINMPGKDMMSELITGIGKVWKWIHHTFIKVSQAFLYPIFLGKYGKWLVSLLVIGTSLLIRSKSFAYE